MFARRMLFGTLLLLLALTPPPAFPAAPAAAAPALKIEEVSLKLSLSDGPKAPQDIARGPDGSLWITESWNNSIARMTTTGLVTVTNEYEIHTPEAVPMEIAPGPDGTMWFAEYGAATGPGKIGHVTPAGLVEEFGVLPADARTWSVVTGPDNNLWFTEYDSNAIGKMASNGTFLGAITLPVAYTQPTDIAVGPDNAIWFTNRGGDALGRIPINATSPADVTIIDLPTGAFPIGIITGPDGNLWFCESGTASIGRYNPRTKELKHFATPTQTFLGDKTGPLELVLGPYNVIWFVEGKANKVASITMDGTITEYDVPTPHAFPNAIAQGPDGRMYFTEQGDAPAYPFVDQVGVFTPPVKIYLPIIYRQ